MRVADFLFEEVLFVQEQYDRGALEPRVRDDCAEQGFRLLHSILHKQKKSVKYLRHRRKSE